MIMFILEMWFFISIPFMLVAMYLFYQGIYRNRVLDSYTSSEIAAVKETLAEIEDSKDLVPSKVETAVVWFCIFAIGGFDGMMWVFDPITYLRTLKAVFKQEFKEL